MILVYFTFLSGYLQARPAANSRFGGQVALQGEGASYFSSRIRRIANSRVGGQVALQGEGASYFLSRIRK